MPLDEALSGEDVQTDVKSPQPRLGMHIYTAKEQTLRQKKLKKQIPSFVFRLVMSCTAVI